MVKRQQSVAQQAMQAVASKNRARIAALKTQQAALKSEIDFLKSQTPDSRLTRLISDYAETLTAMNVASDAYYFAQQQDDWLPNGAGYTAMWESIDTKVSAETNFKAYLVALGLDDDSIVTLVLSVQDAAHEAYFAQQGQHNA